MASLRDLRFVECRLESLRDGAFVLATTSDPQLPLIGGRVSGDGVIEEVLDPRQDVSAVSASIGTDGIPEIRDFDQASHSGPVVVLRDDGLQAGVFKTGPAKAIRRENLLRAWAIVESDGNGSGDVDSVRSTKGANRILTVSGISDGVDFPVAVRLGREAFRLLNRKSSDLPFYVSLRGRIFMRSTPREQPQPGDAVFGWWQGKAYGGHLSKDGMVVSLDPRKIGIMPAGEIVRIVPSGSVPWAEMIDADADSQDTVCVRSPSEVEEPLGNPFVWAPSFGLKASRPLLGMQDVWFSVRSLPEDYRMFHSEHAPPESTREVQVSRLNWETRRCVGVSWDEAVFRISSGGFDRLLCLCSIPLETASLLSEESPVVLLGRVGESVGGCVRGGLIRGESPSEVQAAIVTVQQSRGIHGREFPFFLTPGEAVSRMGSRAIIGVDSGDFLCDSAWTLGEVPSVFRAESAWIFSDGHGGGGFGAMYRNEDTDPPDSGWGDAVAQAISIWPSLKGPIEQVVARDSNGSRSAGRAVITMTPEAEEALEIVDCPGCGERVLAIRGQENHHCGACRRRVS
jgi:hypothetical protein